MKRFQWAFTLGFILFLAAEFVLFSHRFDEWIFQAASWLTSKTIYATWPARLQAIAWIALHVGLIGYLYLEMVFIQRTRYLEIRRRIRKWFERFPEPDSPPPVLGWNMADGLIFLLFVALGGFYFLSMLQNGPFPNIALGGDPANLASFAAGLDHPDLFLKDAILSNLQNLRSYATLNVQIMRWLAPWVGGYALAYAIPILVLTPLNLAGFYLLGRALFRSRYWAFILTVCLAVPITLNLGERWGVMADPVTRYYFQALIPYLLVLTLAWRERISRWPVVLFLAGLMAFIHPVSTPGWAAALWCGYAAALPAKEPRAKKIWVMAGLAAVTLAGLLPYALNYFGAGASQGALHFRPAIEMIEEFFPESLLNVPAALAGLTRILWDSGLLGISLLLGTSLLLMPRKAGAPLNMVMGWFAGVLLAGAALPWVEHALEFAFQITPIETELVRGLRYTVFFLILFSVWALVEWQRRLSDPRWRRGVAVLGLGLAVAWAFAAGPQDFSLTEVTGCWQQGRLACGQPDDGDRLVEAVARMTPPGAALYSTFAESGGLNHSLAIRYQALRALVFCYKDHGQLVTAHSPAAETWLDRVHDLQRIVHQDPPEVQMDRHLFLARQWGASHVITDLKVGPAWFAAHGAALLYQNEKFALIELR